MISKGEGEETGDEVRHNGMAYGVWSREAGSLIGCYWVDLTGSDLEMELELGEADACLRWF
jgi:hypothetical protein